LFEISYYADINQLRWSMSVGCLLDPNSPAARYASRSVLKRPILGCGVILSSQGNKLVISDMHIPYQHRDAIRFLLAVKKKYRCKQILNVGDLFDHHAGSFHLSETDALDPLTEYRTAKKTAHKLQASFPKMVITAGNHDRIPVRKLQSVGLPEQMLSNYNALYDLKDSWEWLERYEFNSGNGKPLLVPMVLTKHCRWNGVLV
jgi:hypothetical protein